jgi:hypothetical protein
MEMNTPKVRAMAANAGIAALAPRSPAVTPSGIAAAARAFAVARAAQQAAAAPAGITSTVTEQQQQDLNAKTDAPGAATAAAARAAVAAKYRCVLDLSTPPGGQNPQQQQVVLPVPAFQQFFGGKRLPGCKSAAAGTSGPADAAASPDVNMAEASAKELKSSSAAAAPAAPAEPPPAATTGSSGANANGKRPRVLNLGDGPTPSVFKGGLVTVTKTPAQVAAAVSCNSGAGGVPAAKKMAVGFLPALHEIERMI